ncbi:hypothetical protein L484_021589 [Morus notabilis]|uniref:Uncharacterized protein n=1 Tax=Morus notabilis TaxID=981085 RepID=W9S5W0_9ROSA|nr:hypothetical protein L484_021589 [Morus notabilis]
MHGNPKKVRISLTANSHRHYSHTTTPIFTATVPHAPPVITSTAPPRRPPLPASNGQPSSLPTSHDQPSLVPTTIVQPNHHRPPSRETHTPPASTARDPNAAGLRCVRRKPSRPLLCETQTPPAAVA